MAKKNKVKVPKKIAGVKVPKKLRKGAIATLVENPRVREIMADVIMAAAGAAAAALVKNRPSGAQVARAGEAVVDTGADAATATRDVVQGAAGAVADVVSEAARRVLPASLASGDGGEGAGNKRERAPEPYDHLAERETKAKKDKHRNKASKH